MKTPFLIQRCELREGKLHYHYMGDAKFESGEQFKALKRILQVGIDDYATTISIEGIEIVVFMVAAKGFPFEYYQPFLQQLAENKLELLVESRFDIALKEALNPTGCDSLYPTHAWFDFQNDVFWTLSGLYVRRLLAEFKRIKPQVV